MVTTEMFLGIALLASMFLIGLLMGFIIISTDGYTIAQIPRDFKRGGEQMQLRQLREAAGLTQRELGNRIGVSGQAVAQWETGVKRPSVENLTKLADVLETSTDAILGRDSA
jgi:DNA-binding XRE family transcriptional regulator